MVDGVINEITEREYPSKGIVDRSFNIVNRSRVVFALIKHLFVVVPPNHLTVRFTKTVDEYDKVFSIFFSVGLKKKEKVSGVLKRFDWFIEFSAIIHLFILQIAESCFYSIIKLCFVIYIDVKVFPEYIFEVFFVVNDRDFCFWKVATEPA